MLPADLLQEPPLVRDIIDVAQSYIGVCEDPVGSNRGADIDAWAREFGSPLGSYWCALFVGHVWKRCGVRMPPRDVGSCDAWVAWAKAAGLWSQVAYPGAAVIYTNHKKLPSGALDATHIGLVVRRKPVVQSIEGNTTTGGNSVQRSGYTVALKEVDLARVLGFVLPTHT